MTGNPGEVEAKEPTDPRRQGPTTTGRGPGAAPTPRVDPHHPLPSQHCPVCPGVQHGKTPPPATHASHLAPSCLQLRRPNPAQSPGSRHRPHFPGTPGLPGSGQETTCRAGPREDTRADPKCLVQGQAPAPRAVALCTQGTLVPGCRPHTTPETAGIPARNPWVPPIHPWDPEVRTTSPTLPRPRPVLRKERERSQAATA